MGILNAIFAPFIVLYLLMYSFFRYFEVSISRRRSCLLGLTFSPQEYHKDPSTIGGRRYTSFAQWKFREFNELPHFFVRRLDESYPLSSMYIGQFPNEKVAIIMRYVLLTRLICLRAIILIVFHLQFHSIHRGLIRCCPRPCNCFRSRSLLPL